MSAHYTYYFCDLLTDEVLLEVPCYGVSFGRTINIATDFTVSISLDRTGYNNQDIIEATVPGRTAFYIDRNGTLVFGGILWTRTYQAQAKTFQYNGQSFESYMYKIVIETDLTYRGRDQRNIVCDLFLYGQGKGNTDIGIQMDPNYPFASNVVRTTNFFAYDTWTVGSALEYLANYDNGLDYTIEVFWDDDGTPGKRVRVDDVLGATVDNTGLAFDYPGNIADYYWSENASKAAVSVVGTGAGDGTSKLVVQSTTTSLTTELLGLGFPDLQEVYSNQDVSVKATLQKQTDTYAGQISTPIVGPTINLDTSTIPALGDWGIGDWAIITIEDPRFPDQFQTSVRVIGFTASPPSGENGVEAVTLVLFGEDIGNQ